MKILLVEDDPFVSELLKTNIEKWRHEGAVADNGKDAVEMVRNEKFDLVILDIFLPDCKGHELIPQFKAVDPKIGVITITGYNSRELELEIRRHGILHYLIKPVDLKTLKTIVDHIAQKIDQGKGW